MKTLFLVFKDLLNSGIQEESMKLFDSIDKANEYVKELKKEDGYFYSYNIYKIKELTLN